MNIAGTYAKALFQAQKEQPQKGSEQLANLKVLLARRGHQKLFAHVFAEYQKLFQRQERAVRYATVTPEQERTRVLLELYRHLIHAK